MRILFITATIPYPKISGAPLRTYNLLRHLASRHDVYLVAFADTPEQREGIGHLRQFCRMVEAVDLPDDHALNRPLEGLRYLFKGIPPDLRFVRAESLARIIRRLVDDVHFDIVQIEHTSMGVYLDILPAELRQRAVWMVHDIDFSRYARMAHVETRWRRRLRLWLHGRLLRKWEPGIAARFERTIVVSDSDRNILLTADPRLQVEVVPNGVDTRLFEPLPPPAKPDLVFVGNMNAVACVDAMTYFCRQILPLVRAAVPEVELWIVGIDPRDEVKALAGNGVHVTGRVDDVRPYYERSSVCVVPLRAGGGTRLKILESMALNRPVVSTTIGCEGLQVQDGIHLLIADSPAHLAASTIRLLQDAELRAALTRQARQLVVARYDWEAIATGLMQIYQDVAHQAREHNKMPEAKPENASLHHGGSVWP